MDIVWWILAALVALIALVAAGAALFNALTLAGSYLFARHVLARGEAAPALPYPNGLFAAWRYETRVLIRILLTLPLALVWCGPCNRAKDNTKLPVLFLHGYTENHLVWRPLIRALHRDPSRRLYTLWMRPAQASIDRFRDQAAARIRAILKETGHSQVILVGHSMGGIVARAVIAHDGPDAIAHVITLGTPHQGTSWAFAWPFLPAVQMRTGSEYLAALGGTPGLRGVGLTAIATLHDNIVVPFPQATLPARPQHLVSGIAHIGLMSHPRTMALVTAKLAEPDAVLTARQG